MQFVVGVLAFVFICASSPSSTPSRPSDILDPSENDQSFSSQKQLGPRATKRQGVPSADDKADRPSSSSIQSTSSGIVVPNPIHGQSSVSNPNEFEAVHEDYNTGLPLARALSFGNLLGNDVTLESGVNDAVEDENSVDDFSIPNSNEHSRCPQLDDDLLNKSKTVHKEFRLESENFYMNPTLNFPPPPSLFHTLNPSFNSQPSGSSETGYFLSRIPPLPGSSTPSTALNNQPGSSSSSSHSLPSIPSFPIFSSSNTDISNPASSNSGANQSYSSNLLPGSSSSSGVAPPQQVSSAASSQEYALSNSSSSNGNQCPHQGNNEPNQLNFDGTADFATGSVINGGSSNFMRSVDPRFSSPMPTRRHPNWVPNDGIGSQMIWYGFNTPSPTVRDPNNCPWAPRHDRYPPGPDGDGQGGVGA